VVGTCDLRPSSLALCAHDANAGTAVAEHGRRPGIGSGLCQHSLPAARRLGFRAMPFNLMVSTNSAGICNLDHRCAKTDLLLADHSSASGLGGDSCCRSSGQVLALAKVSSTKELKRANVDLRHLDFRLKASWRSALEVLQQAAVAMAEWDRNPAEDDKALLPSARD